MEFELKDQKKRINALEIVADPKASSNDPDVIKIIENAQGRIVLIVHVRTKISRLFKESKISH